MKCSSAVSGLSRRSVPPLLLQAESLEIRWLRLTVSLSCNNLSAGFRRTGGSLCICPPFPKGDAAVFAAEGSRDPSWSPLMRFAKGEKSPWGCRYSRLNLDGSHALG